MTAALDPNAHLPVDPRSLPPRAARSPVRIEAPEERHAEAFVEAVRASRALHGRWVAPPDSLEAFAKYVDAVQSDEARVGFLVFERASGALVGGANASQIVRGAFRSCYLGYQAFAPLAGLGLMRAGLALILDALFGEHGLHRVEANVQPENTRSIAVAKSLGFRFEGFSPRYLKINGRWRDHERYALVAEDWRRGKVRVRDRGRR